MQLLYSFADGEPYKSIDEFFTVLFVLFAEPLYLSVYTHTEPG